MHRVITAIAFCLMMVGIAMLDSEQMLLPIVISIISASVLAYEGIFNYDKL